MNALLKDKFSFGGIVVDPKSNAIYLNGVEKRLEPKLITLLCLLAAQGRNVISRQEITQVIWSDVVVGEESITRAIFALRNALGDDAKQPQYIETIPKKGYRFLVDATLISETSADGPTTLGQQSSARRGWFLAIAALAFMVVLSALWMWSAHNKPIMEVESVLPLNKMEGVERYIKLSGDAEKLLFVHQMGQVYDIYSRDLQGAKDTLWVHDEYLKSSPVWIDENSIAYIRRDKSGFQIVRHHLGQAPQVLYQSTNAILQVAMVEKSDNLFFLEVQTNDLTDLKSLNLRSGEQQNWRDIVSNLPKRLKQLESSAGQNNLLLVHNEHEKPVIVSLDLNTKAIALVSDEFKKVSKVTAVGEQGLLVVGTIDLSQGIWGIAKQTSPQLVLRSSGSDEIVEAEMDVKRHVIFYANVQENTDIRLLSIHSQDEYELPGLNSSGIEMNGAFSRDHKFIYFISNRTGFYEIWRYEIGAGSLKQISTLNALMISWFSMSHNGQSLAVSYRADDLFLEILDAETGQLQRRTKTPVNRFPLDWGFDDKTIYVSEHEAQVNLFAYDTATLTPQLFAPKAGLYVKDIDGKKLMYIDYSRHALIERNLVTQQEKILHDTILNLSWLAPGLIHLNKSNDGFFAECEMDGRNQLCAYSLASPHGAPASAKIMPYRMWVNDVADDERVLVNEFKPASGDIMRMQLRN